MITCNEIKKLYRPFDNRREANRYIKNRKIIKRPGVFIDDKKELYVIIDTTESAIILENRKGERNYYRFENIMLDYLFEDGEVIGVKL